MATDDELTGAVAEALSRFAEQLGSELGEAPRLQDLLEVLGWAAGSLGADLAEEPPVPVELKARYRKGVDPPEPGPSRTVELNDNVFVDAGDLLSRIARRIADGTGEPPTLADLVKVLGQGLRSAGDGSLADVGPDDLSGLSVVKPRAAKRAKPGDLVAIPAEDDRHHLAVALARDVWGTALGLFKGTHRALPVSPSHHPDIEKHPVHVDDEAVASGRWRIVGHGDDLVDLFPSPPEIYHVPRKDFPTSAVGPHGAAEAPGGKLRQLTEAEAREIGIFEPGFQQIYNGTQLEKRLAHKDSSG